LSQPSKDSRVIKDERWVIKIFRPLLQMLDVQHIPPPPDFTVVYLDRREWIIQGMGKCILVIEQKDLPGNIGGMLVTSHDNELDYFRLHILINSNLCAKTTIEARIEQKIAAIHEFTHAIATLSAISRVRSKDLIKKLKEKFKTKVHAIYYDDIKQVAAELSNSLSIKINNLGKPERRKYFPDKHFRLGFEDIPVSYPVIFEALLLSREMLFEYFTEDTVQLMCNTLSRRDGRAFSRVVTPITLRIAADKALTVQFVAARILEIFLPIYANYSLSLREG
jgi:hypothetical protein